MDDERARLIRDHWRRYGSRMNWNPAKDGPFLRVPVWGPVRVGYTGNEPPAAPVSVLTFAFETGSIDGRPAARIVCEGVVVAEGVA